MTYQPTDITPVEAPIQMPAQNLRAGFTDQVAPGLSADEPLPWWRAFSFGPAIAATAVFLYTMWDWFADGGVSWIEATLLGLISFNFFWLCFTVSTVALGLATLSRQERRPVTRPVPPQKVALLMPIYNEEPWYVLGNAASMLEELRSRNGGHEYAVFVLSDTRDEEIARAEYEIILALRASLAPDMQIYYRRRPKNTDRKVGNIADWVQRWGGDWPAMLVLDADSLMTGRAIVRLTDALALDPSAGLIQSFPQLIGAQSVFSRMQQFANGVYGAALAEGLSRWCGQEGNYWGHNAIIRTAAFASSAGLPKMRGLGGREQLIMSHDFVEAGLLRRAGWGVRFLPRIRGSYEETPHTLIDHIQRDRRWCHGNLQHLRLLWTPGLKPVSRFHLFHGAIGYLLSPIWFALLVMWALIGLGEEASVLTYFSPENPLMPTWPELSEGRHVFIILLMYGLLLAPKLMGIAAIPLTGAKFAEFGGKRRFAISTVSEILLSVLYAPILMVQQMIAVCRVAFGLQQGWAPQDRNGGRYGLWDLVRCHALETVSGVSLMAGILAGLISAWLLPIAISLCLAIPLSGFSGVSLGRRLSGWMATREEFNAPQVSQAAQHHRSALKAVLEGSRNAATPAE